jgi:anti-sigma B factor antagonist
VTRTPDLSGGGEHLPGHRNGTVGPYTSAQLFGLTVRRPAVGVCVVAVVGELDILTTSLLEACAREQLAAVPTPTHLILDLEAVRFLGASGLSCLLRAHELTQQSSGTRLHVAGLVNRVVARSLGVTGLVGIFDSYPCVTDALAALVESTDVTINTEQVALLSIIGHLDVAGLGQLRLQLQALLDTDTKYVVVNLAGVGSCDHRLFDVLAQAHHGLTDRQGWLRLVGVGPAVRNALDEATTSECLLVYQAAEWTRDLAG